MINAYEVGATLKLHDLISPALLKIAEQLEKIEGRIVKINGQLGIMKREGAALGTIGTEFKGIAASAKAMQENMSKASNQALKLKERLNTVGASGVEKAATATGALSGELTTATAKAAVLRNTLRGMGVAGAAGVAAAGGGGRRHHGGIHGGRIHAGTHGVGVGSIGMAGGAAVPLLIGGAVGASLLKYPYEQARSLAQAQADFSTMNLSPAQQNEVFETAKRLSSQIKGTTITQAVKTIHDLQTVFGDLHHALAAAPSFLRSEFVMQAMAGGDEHAREGMSLALGKALEHRPGLTSQANFGAANSQFEREKEMFMQAYMYTRGNFNPRALFQVQQTGKAAYAMMSPEFLYGPFAAYAASKSGSTAGTAAMSAFNALAAGTMTERAAGWLYSHGLWQMGQGAPQALRDQAKNEPALQTVVKQMDKSLRYKGGLVDTQMFMRDAYGWTMKYMLPAVEKDVGHKVDLMNSKDLALFDLKVAKSGLARNVSGYIVDLVNEAVRLQKENAGIRKSMTTQQAMDMYMKNPVGAEMAANASWKNFMTVIGLQYLPTITEGLRKLSDRLDSLSKWVSDNPGKVKVLTHALIGLTGAMLFSGSVLALAAGLRATKTAAVALWGAGRTLGRWLVSAAMLVGRFSWRLLGFLGPVGRAIVIIGTLGYTVYKNWDTIKKYTTEFAGWIVAKFKAIYDGIKNLTRNDSGPRKALENKLPAPIQGWRPHLFPNSDKREPMVQSGGHQKVSFTVPVYLDGRPIAEHTVRHIARMSNGPQSGTSGVDYSATMAPLA